MRGFEKTYHEIIKQGITKQILPVNLFLYLMAPNDQNIYTPYLHIVMKHGMVWKQTKRYCFNFFNLNFLEPRPLSLHENCKQTEAKLIQYYHFLERAVQASFVRNAGENCAISSCSVSRKDKRINIFKVPLAKNKFRKKWSQDLNNDILKYRQRDKSLIERIESDKSFIFENILLLTRYMFTLLLNH